jgi:hypothetical protein
MGALLLQHYQFIGQSLLHAVLGEQQGREDLERAEGRGMDLQAPLLQGMPSGIHG